MCVITHPWVWHLIRDISFVTSHSWYVSFTCVTWLIHMCDFTDSHVWHSVNSYVCHPSVDDHSFAHILFVTYTVWQVIHTHFIRDISFVTTHSHTFLLWHIPSDNSFAHIPFVKYTVSQLNHTHFIRDILFVTTDTHTFHSWRLICDNSFAHNPELTVLGSAEKEQIVCPSPPGSLFFLELNATNEISRMRCHEWDVTNMSKKCHTRDQVVLHI